jgi:hypothetical protein
MTSAKLCCRLMGLLLMIWSITASPCEAILRKSTHLGPQPIYDFSVGMMGRFKPNGYNAERLLAILKSNYYVPIVNGDRFWMVVFEPESKSFDGPSKDLGYVLRGKIEHGQYIFDAVKKADYMSQVNYFKRVAQMNRVQDRYFRLKQGLSQCRELAVKAATQVKLWLKHRIRPEDAFEIVNNSTPELSARVTQNQNERFSYLGRIKDGRTIRTIVEIGPDCSQRLVTAFEPALN